MVGAWHLHPTLLGQCRDLKTHFCDGGGESPLFSFSVHLHRMHALCRVECHLVEAVRQVGCWSPSCSTANHRSGLFCVTTGIAPDHAILHQVSRGISQIVGHLSAVRCRVGPTSKLVRVQSCVSRGGKSNKGPGWHVCGTELQC